MLMIGRSEYTIYVSKIHMGNNQEFFLFVSRKHQYYNDNFFHIGGKSKSSCITIDYHIQFCHHQVFKRIKSVILLYFSGMIIYNGKLFFLCLGVSRESHFTHRDI